MRKYNAEVLLNEDDISYYILGLAITDGNVFFKTKNGGTFEIKSIDYDILDKIRNLVCKESIISIVDNRIYRLRFFNKVINKWLIDHECVPNKTKIVKFPNVPKEYVSHFLRGLIDGDGSIGLYPAPLVRFDSASYDLISGVQKTLETIGVSCNINKTPWIKTKIGDYVTESTTQMYRITICSLNAYKVLKYIYLNDRISFDRKKNKALEVFNYYEGRGFSEEDLLKLSRITTINWMSNEKLIELMNKHSGSLVKASEELGTSAWGLSNKLRKLGLYEDFRNKFPINNIANITKKYKSKIKVPDEQLKAIYELMDKKVSYEEIGKLFSLNKEYVAFLKRRKNKIAKAIDIG